MYVRNGKAVAEGVEAIAFGEAVLLVVPYSAVPEIGKEFGSALATKPLVIDVSNPSGQICY